MRFWRKKRGTPALPCRQAGFNCPPQLGQNSCVITAEQIMQAQDRGDAGFLGAVALCQFNQNQAKDKGLVPDPKTGLDSIELMYARAEARFDHPPRKMDQITLPNGKEVLTALIAFIDGNKFREHNKHGHDFGDDVLRALAKLLRDNTRDSDLLGRWGRESDELVAVMPGMSREDADRKVDSLQEIFARGTEIPAPNGQNVRLTAGVGSAYVGNVETFQDIRDGVRDADLAVITWKSTDRQGEPERQYLKLYDEAPIQPESLHLPPTS